MSYSSGETRQAARVSVTDSRCGQGFAPAGTHLGVVAAESFWFASWNQHYIKYFCKEKFPAMNSIFQFKIGIGIFFL